MPLAPGCRCLCVLVLTPSTTMPSITEFPASRTISDDTSHEGDLMCKGLHGSGRRRYLAIRGTTSGLIFSIQGFIDEEGTFTKETDGVSVLRALPKSASGVISGFSTIHEVPRILEGTWTFLVFSLLDGGDYRNGV